MRLWSDVEAVRQRSRGSRWSNAGHVSAAQLLGTGAWTLEGAESAHRSAGHGQEDAQPDGERGGGKNHPPGAAAAGRADTFLVVPGEGAAPAPLRRPVAPLAGSVQEAALAHPLVQRAQEIFKAEVRSVVDLRQK